MKRSSSYHRSSMKRSLSRDEDYDLWFPDTSIDYHLAGEPSRNTVSEPDDLEDLLRMADSMDGDESLKPGMYAECFNDTQNTRQYDKIPLTPPTTTTSTRYSERPTTPPTIKPSFHRLPPRISPDLGMDVDSDHMSLVDEAFRPPKRLRPKVARGRKVPRTHPPHRVATPYEQSLLHKLVQSMSRSHASRREILRRRHFFGNHPSLYEFERLDDSQRRIWTFIASQHLHSST